MPPGAAAAGKMIKIMKPALKKLFKAGTKGAKTVAKKTGDVAKATGKKISKGAKRVAAEVRRRTVSRRRFAKTPAGGRAISRSEGKAISETMGRIRTGNKPAGKLKKKWGSKFGNHDGKLPGKVGKNSPYKEYRVDPGPGVAKPGARRIVTDESAGQVYYTADHYKTFWRLK